MEINQEWIAKQRAAALEALNMQPCAHRAGLRLRLFGAVLPAALDALEASMQREAEKDATIVRLTAERDAAVQTAVQKCWMVRKAGELGYTEPPIINGRCFGYGGGDSDEPPCEECNACGLCADNAPEVSE